jgi:tRNA A37 threonylcarbamoyladenosine dehydratase
MENPFIRTEWLIGTEALEKLQKSHVALFGVGGVGSCAAEALARCGVGELTLIDHDVIAKSNINRQLHALHGTVNGEKVTVMRERMLDINPEAVVHAVNERFLPDGHNWLFDCVMDAVDTVSCKLRIIMEAKKRNIPVISAMGAGNRLDPARFRVGDIYETKGCPLAKVMRNLCRKNGIKDLKVVYSEEPPKEALFRDRKAIGSIAFVPAAAGLLMAAEAVNGIIIKNIRE